MVKEYYPEIAQLDYQALVKTYSFSEICQKSVPQAIYCFLISDSLEDAIRNCISIGGDCDTTAAMSCAVAEAFYGIPNNLKEQIMEYLDIDMIELIEKFQNKFGIK